MTRVILISDKPNSQRFSQNNGFKMVRVFEASHYRAAQEGSSFRKHYIIAGPSSKIIMFDVFSCSYAAP